MRGRGDSRPDDVEVRDNPSALRYEARLDGDVVGVLSYERSPALPGLLTLVHTEVEPAVEGKGVGSRLVAGALEDIRSRGLSIVAVCPFVRAYLRRHPEQADLTAEG